ncbi:MAG: T9SS type A sorting domain-containing protein [Chlorobi bacterium]|nr:T9SS type A sorting domain-containing protein [Chlorobiota bacterium]
MYRDVLTALVIAMGILLGFSYSQAKTWDGGAATNKWTDGNNWNPDGVPTSSDDVDLTSGTAASILLDGVGNCRTLKIGGGFTLEINGSGAQLIIAGDGGSVVDVDIQDGGTIKALSGTGPLLNFSSSSDEFKIQNGGTYIHGAGSFPDAGKFTFSSTSTVEYRTGTGFKKTVTYGHLVCNGAVLNAVSSSLDIRGDLKIEAGEFRGTTSNSPTHSISGSIVITGGTFTGSNGSGNPTFLIGGSLNQTGGTYKAAKTSGSPTLKFTGTGDINLSGTVSNWKHNVIIDGTITLKSGFTVASGHTLTVNASKTFNESGSQTLTFNGSTLTNNGTIALSNVKFSGSAAQTLAGSGSFSSSTTVTINNASGVSLTGDMSILGSLTVTSGDFDLNGHVLTFGTSGSLTESSTDHVVDNSGSEGYISATRTLNAPSSENVAGLGAVITSSANLGSTEVRRGHKPQTGGGSSGIKRFYDISPANNTGLNATLRFYYYDDELNGLNEQQFSLFRSTDGGNTWADLGGSVNTSSNYIEKTGIDAFSRWTVAEGGMLPVELTSFIARRVDDKILLRWKTATEVNNYGFDIERSLDSRHWRRIAFIQGQGTINTPQTYQYTDFPPPSVLSQPLVYYRLRQIDRDGGFEFSDVVTVANTHRTSAGPVLFQNYPNPFSGRTTFTFSLPERSRVRLEIFDALGKKCATVLNNVVCEAGSQTVAFVNKSLQPGVYLLRLRAEGTTRTRTLLVR